MPNKICKGIVALDQLIDKTRGWHYIILLIATVAFIANQNFRIIAQDYSGWINELAVLAVFAAGIIITRLLKRTFKLSVLFWLYLFGLAFEIITESKWNYKHIIFVIREDISITFPLGWTGLCIAATSVSEVFYKKIRSIKAVNIRDNLLIRLDVIVWIILGSTTETIFFRLGMIDQYLETYPFGMSFFGPPWWILIWYGIFPGFIMSLLIRNLEYDAYELRI